MLPKNKHLKKFLSLLDKEKFEAIVGLEDKDALRYGFPQTQVIHPGPRANMLEKTKWPNSWKHLLSQKGMPGKRVAYIHIPFCRSKCLYCGFFQNFCDDNLENLYIDHLLKELKLCQSTYLNAFPLQAVYIGGGSPSSISPDNCARLLKAIKQYLPLANDCELTFESRISDMTEKRQEALFANGVNRISLGVQTFDTKLRRTMGRIDSKEEILACLEKLSSYDQAAIVIDLIYGFPSQSLEMWLEDVHLLKKAALDGFDLYHLKVHPNSPLQKAIDNNSLSPAATLAQKAVMFAEAEKILSNYSRRSVCHWAKNHRERNLYNSLSKSGAQIIPFGCGAGGNIQGFGLFLERDLNLYSKQIDSGEKPLAYMGKPHWLGKMSRTVTGQIEEGYLDLAGLAGYYGQEVLEIEELLTVWENRGLVKKEQDVIHLEVAGRFWHVNITQALIECFQEILARKQFENQELASYLG